MTNENYWKERYGHAWDKSKFREESIKEKIKNETNRSVVNVGLGAGSAEYIPGTAKNSGYERGGADLKIDGLNIYLEVTGPQVKSIDLSKPLWIRPDKIENAKKNYPLHETWVIHWLERDGTLRVINLNNDFFESVAKGIYKTVLPVIRGTTEKYIEVPSEDPCVKNWKTLIDRIKSVNMDQ